MFKLHTILNKNQPDKQNEATKAMWMERAKQEKVSLEIDMATDLAKQFEMIEFTEQDLQLIKAIKPIIDENITEIVDAFYISVTNVPHLKEIIESNSSLERLRQTLTMHVTEMFVGKIDQEFIEKRLRIAFVHQRIGLEPKWYMGAFQNLLNRCIMVMYRNIHHSDDMIEITKVITKLLNLEQQIVLEAYEQENVRKRELQAQAVRDELKAKIYAVSEELATLAEQSNASVEELVSSSNEVNHSYLITVAKSKATGELAAQGQQSMRELSQIISDITVSTQGMGQAVRQLLDSSGQINKIVLVVQEIASQTKLLSLNAAIEAARAGEHGKGFSVVAAEVQKLAEDTRRAVEQITALTTVSNHHSKHVLNSIKEMQQFITSGDHKSQYTISAFDEIIDAMQGNLQEMVKVESEMESLVKVIEEMGSATGNVAALSEQLNETTKNL